MRASDVYHIYLIQSYESFDWPKVNVSGSNWISIFFFIGTVIPMCTYAIFNDTA